MPFEDTISLGLLQCGKQSSFFPSTDKGSSYVTGPLAEQAVRARKVQQHKIPVAHINFLQKHWALHVFLFSFIFQNSVL